MSKNYIFIWGLILSLNIQANSCKFGAYLDSIKSGRKYIKQIELKKGGSTDIEFPKKIFSISCKFEAMEFNDEFTLCSIKCFDKLSKNTYEIYNQSDLKNETTLKVSTNKFNDKYDAIIQIMRVDGVVYTESEFNRVKGEVDSKINKIIENAGKNQ